MNTVDITHGYGEYFNHYDEVNEVRYYLKERAAEVRKLDGEMIVLHNVDYIRADKHVLYVEC